MRPAASPKLLGPHISGRGVIQLMRPVPLSIWSVPTVLFGFLTHPARQAHWVSALVLAILGALLLQGIITHGLNDLYDWQSGTDQASPGVISGGSKVLKLGLLNESGIWWVIAGGSAAYVLVSLVMAAIRGPGVLGWAFVGLAGSVLYSLPPMRLSYRPFLGEWAALFPAMVSGVALGGLAAQTTLTPVELWAAIWYGIFCVASVMQHHFADIEADWLAVPQKRTTPAFWKWQVRRSPKELVAFYGLLGMAVALYAMPEAPAIFAPAAAASIMEILFTLTTAVDGNIAHLTRRDLSIKVLAPATVLILFAIRLLG